MIKWRAAGRKGRDLIGFGLEAGNVQELMDGKPMFIDGAPLGLHHDLFIHYGATKEAMIEELRENGLSLPPEKEWKHNG